MSNNSIKFTTYPVVNEINADTVFPTLEKWNGDNLLILKQDTTSYSRQLAIVVCGNEGTVLSIVKYNKDENLECFLPINPNFNSDEIGDGIQECFHILGIPILMLRDIGNI